MSDMPLTALSIGRASQQPAPYQNPFAVLTDFAHMQKAEQEVVQQKRTMQAQKELGETIASTPDRTQLAGKLLNHWGIAYHPDIGNMITAADERMAQIYATQQTSTHQATQGLGKAMLRFALDPNPSSELFDSIVDQEAANTHDPAVRANLYKWAREAKAGLTMGLPSREEMLSDPTASARARAMVQQRVTGLYASSFGTWDAAQAAAVGGRIHVIGDSIYRESLARPGTIEQVRTQRPGAFPPPPSEVPPPPGAAAVPPPGAAAGPPNALSPPPGGAPAPGGAPPLAMPPPPAPDTGPPAGAPANYAPGAVTTEPLGPPGETPPAAAAPAPAAPAPAPAAAAQLVAPKVAPDDPNKFIWGPGASSHSLSNGVPISQVDGRLLFRPGTLARHRPYGETAHGTPQWREDQPKVDGLMKEFTEKDPTHFANAEQITQAASSLRNAYNHLQYSGLDWTKPGPGLPAKMDIYRTINSIRELVGAPSDLKALQAEASFADLSKTAIRLGFSAVSTFFPGQREAMQTIQTALNAVPGIHNTFLAGQLLTRTLEVLAQRQMDMYAFKSQFSKENRGNLIDWDIAFNQRHPPSKVAEDVLSEFGLGKDGFGKGAAGAARIKEAVDNKLLTWDQGRDALAGREIGENPNLGK
jgi:hypothetical protein